MGLTGKKRILDRKSKYTAQFYGRCELQGDETFELANHGKILKLRPLCQSSAKPPDDSEATPGKQSLKRMTSWAMRRITEQGQSNILNSGAGNSSSRV